jgi:predicted RNA binding protein YcfA (HicA-like mRNA interferase family)
MPKKFPPLTYRETAAILAALGFAVTNTEGSHEQWEGMTGGARRKVTLKKNAEYDFRDITSHIAQAGVSRKAYYGATKSTAKKIGL